jgi:hypothetical protein
MLPSLPVHVGVPIAAEVAFLDAFGFVLARPTGFNRADAISIRIPIEGASLCLVAEGA